MEKPYVGERDSLVFLDESGIDIDMTRHYVRAKTDERAVDSTPLNTPNTTMLSSIRLDGWTAYTVYQGGMTVERFAEYLKEALLPNLSSDDIIMMDNMRSHHAKAVKQVLDASGIRYLYLPPYSPDFNPIEKMWSKLKAYLRKAKVRTLLELPDAVEDAFAIKAIHWLVCSLCATGGMAIDKGLGTTPRLYFFEAQKRSNPFSTAAYTSWKTYPGPQVARLSKKCQALFRHAPRKGVPFP